MRLLVFAHVPPPFHGQSYMVELMLRGLRKDQGAIDGGNELECFHVDCRISEELDQIGKFQWRKIPRIFRHIASALRLRMRHGAMAFYYVPAQPSRSALYRDWVVLGALRPFFGPLIFHWHAVGLSEWLREKGTSLERAITRVFLGTPHLSIVVADAVSEDARWLNSRQIAVVHNGVPDPLPKFDEELLARRIVRLRVRRKLMAQEALSSDERYAAGDDPEVFRVLFLSHLTREKGLFDALDAVALANEHLREARSLVAIQLTVAGRFASEHEEREFRQRIDRAGTQNSVVLVGFASGTRKIELLRNSDCLCFPSYHRAESLSVAMIEALAAGLVVVATDWRAAAEVLPPDWPGLVPIRSSIQLAKALLDSITRDGAVELRNRFLENFTEENYVKKVREALR